MSDLYRLATIDEHKYLNDPEYYQAKEQLTRMVEVGVLVPVEPCEHGNYDAHLIATPWVESGEVWCPGAGI